jgi:Family of unknown function (DUF6134)
MSQHVLAMRALLAALLLVPFGPAPAAACSHPPSPAEYLIRHETYGEIGRHVITFACEGAQTIVEARVTIEIDILKIPVFRRRAHYREVWQDDRLIAFDSQFDENGKPYEVHARADGERMIVEGEDGRIGAPASVISNHPWNGALVLRPLLFDTRTGRLQRVRVTPVGEVAIEVGGHPILARRYHVDGDLERELWYDREGPWLQSRLTYEGKAITLTLQ